MPDQTPTAEALQKLADARVEGLDDPTIAATKFSVEGDFSLQGHAGALYLEVVNDGKKKRVPQTVGQPGFHDDLGALVRKHLGKNGGIASYQSELTAYVLKNLWDSDIGFVPGDLHEPLDALIPAAYVGSSNRSWSDNLAGLRSEAQGAKEAVDGDISTAFEGV
jgi:hypothetical protein